MADKNDIYGIDTPAQIRSCLTCVRHECINCLKRAKGKESNFIRNAPVYQYDRETMELIREWPSAAAAARGLGIGHPAISSALHGHIRHAGGFIWRWGRLRPKG